MFFKRIMVLKGIQTVQRKRETLRKPSSKVGLGSEASESSSASDLSDLNLLRKVILE